MKEMCLWCKHWRMEYRPDACRNYIKQEWYIGTTLFLGCAKGPVEDESKNHNDWCGSFKWNYKE